jgi:hypothetical protein
MARATRSSRIIHVVLSGGDRKARAKRDSPDVHVPPLGHPTARSPTRRHAPQSASIIGIEVGSRLQVETGRITRVRTVRPSCRLTGRQDQD